MTAFECVLCLESSEDPVGCVKVGSAEWKEQSIESIIEKHLWPMATLTSKSSWLCLTCFQILLDFHKFYRRVEEVHLYLECLVKSENEIEIENSTLLPENLIIPEARLDESCIFNEGNDNDNANLPLSTHISEGDENLSSENVKTQESARLFAEGKKTTENKLVKTEDVAFTGNMVGDGNIFEIKKGQDYENDLSFHDSDDSTADSRNSNTKVSTSNEKFQTEVTTIDYDDFLAKHFKIICVICQTPFKTFSMLQRHFLTDHQEEAHVFCCHKKIKRRSDLVEHVYSHLHPDYLTCKYCSKVLMGRRSLLRHVAMHERKAKNGEKVNKKLFKRSEMEKDKLLHRPKEKKADSDFEEESLDENDDDSIHLEYNNRCDSLEDTEERSESEEEMDEEDIATKSDMLDPDEINPLDVSNRNDTTPKVNLTYQPEVGLEEYDDFIAKYFAITCNICDQSCKTFAKLRQHFATVHKKEAFVTCCGRKIKRPRCLYEHIHSHLNPDYFKCKYCARVLKDRRNLLLHIESIHREKLVRCDICNKKFLNKPAMEKHKSIHMPEPRKKESQPENSLSKSNIDKALPEPLPYKGDSQRRDEQFSERFQPDADREEDYDDFLSKHIQLSCVLCKEPFTNFAKLRQHFTTTHKQEVYVLCCGRKHKRRRCLVEHIKSHLNPDFFKCKYCPRVLKERRHYINHISIHEGRTFRCEVCDKTFANKSEFEKHKLAHYPNEFPCPDCKKSFDKKHQLRRHLSVAHTNKKKSQKSEAEKEPNELDRNVTANFIKIETNFSTINAVGDDNSQTTMDQSYETDEPNENDASSEESEKSNSDESELKYLPQTNPAEYDDFLEKHIKFTCSICQEMCRNFAVLKHNFTAVHRQVGYVLCCGTKHRTRSFLVDHVNTHLNPDYFKCNLCSKTFKERRGLVAHRAWHKGKTYRCVICQISFLNKSKFKAHRLTHLSKEKPKFPCPDCGKIFGNKPLLGHHQKAIHDNKYVKLCDICGVSFRGSECFKSHMEKHQGVATPSFPCDICGRILSGKRSLKIHKISIHPEGGVLPYTCHICSKSVATQSYLNAHIRKAHSTSYNHKCSICGKAFKELKNLKTHMVIHTGVPLYTCTWCPKTFNSSGNLSSHRQRVHPKEWDEWKRKQYLDGLPPRKKNKSKT